MAIQMRTAVPTRSGSYVQSGGGGSVDSNYGYVPSKGLPFPGLKPYTPETPRYMPPTPSMPSGGMGGAPSFRAPDLSGLYNSLMNPQTEPGPVLDPMQVAVPEPEMPDAAKMGLLGASQAATGAGWREQPVQQMETQNIGKRIYPEPGKALTQKGNRVF